MILRRLNAFLLFSAALLFCALLLILAFHSRAASNDFTFIGILQDYGMWGSVKYLYFNFSGRWSTTAVVNFIFSGGRSIVDAHWFIFIYHVSCFSLLFAAVYSILTSAAEYFLKEMPSPKKRFVFSVLFIAVFYFTTFCANEAWFWVCCSVAYLSAITLSAFGIALLVHKKQNVLRTIFLLLCFAYTGGGLETWSLILLSAFSVLLFFRLKKEKWNFFSLVKNRFSKNLLLAFLFLLASTCVNFFAPGNFKRKQEEKILAQEVKSGELNSNTKKISWPPDKKYALALLLLIPWAAAGVQLKNKLRNEFSAISSLKKQFWISIGIIAFVAGISAGFLCAVFGYPGPARAWLPFNFILAILLCYWSFIAGMKFRWTEKIPAEGFLVVNLVLIVALSGYNIRQFTLTKNFAAAYDRRMNYLLELKKENVHDTTIFVDPLPDPGMLVYGEDASIPDYGLEKALGLKFEVKAKK